jgi:hypothetical protein
MLHLLDQSQCCYLSSPPSSVVERARPWPTSDLRPHRTPLDEDLHFHRYRGITLDAPWAELLPWTVAYRQYVRDGERRAGIGGRRWTSPLRSGCSAGPTLMVSSVYTGHRDGRAGPLRRDEGRGGYGRPGEAGENIDLRHCGGCRAQRRALRSRARLGGRHCRVGRPADLLSKSWHRRPHHPLPRPYRVQSDAFGLNRYLQDDPQRGAFARDRKVYAPLISSHLPSMSSFSC